MFTKRRSIKIGAMLLIVGGAQKGFLHPKTLEGLMILSGTYRDTKTASLRHVTSRVGCSPTTDLHNLSPRSEVVIST